MSPRARLASKRARSVATVVSASGRPQRLLRKGQTQQQPVHALLVLDERNDFGGAVLFEQPVAVGADRVEIARVGGERRPEMRVGGGVAAPLRDLSKQRLEPGLRVGGRIGTR